MTPADLFNEPDLGLPASPSVWRRHLWREGDVLHVACAEAVVKIALGNPWVTPEGGVTFDLTQGRVALALATHDGDTLIVDASLEGVHVYAGTWLREALREHRSNGDVLREAGLLTRHAPYGAVGVHPSYEALLSMAGNGECPLGIKHARGLVESLSPEELELAELAARTRARALKDQVAEAGHVTPEGCIERDDLDVVWTALRLVRHGARLGRGLASLDALVHEVGEPLEGMPSSPMLRDVRRACPEAWWAS